MEEIEVLKRILKNKKIVAIVAIALIGAVDGAIASLNSRKKTNK